MKLITDDKRINQIRNTLNKIPNEYDKLKVMMSIFRKASKPMLSAAENTLAGRVPNLYVEAAQHIKARQAKSGEVMRIGMLNKGYGRLGYIFDRGTKKRVTRSGWKTGKITATDWWRDAVAMSEDKVIDAVLKEAPRKVNSYLNKLKT